MASLPIHAHTDAARGCSQRPRRDATRISTSLNVTPLVLALVTVRGHPWHETDGSIVTGLTRFNTPKPVSSR
jgi:hypothetical protein